MTKSYWSELRTISHICPFLSISMAKALTWPPTSLFAGSLICSDAASAMPPPPDAPSHHPASDNSADVDTRFHLQLPLRLLPPTGLKLCALRKPWVFPHRASASCSFYLYATACSRCLTSCWLAPICYPPNWGGHFFIPPEQDTEERKPRNVKSQTSPFSLTCSPHSQGCNLQTVCMWALTSPWSQLTKALDEHLLQALANQSPSPWNLKLEFKLVLEQRWPVGSQSGYYWISIREIRGNLICADRQQWSRSRDKRPYGQEREESKLSNSRNLGFPILSSSLSSSSALSLSSMNYP